MVNPHVQRQALKTFAEGLEERGVVRLPGLFQRDRKGVVGERNQTMALSFEGVI